ncbi:MAG: galactitol system component [Oceanotoga sp.]|jgi:PTS system galactitol-specific IIC component|uniref:PTS system galactitol-specific IIC component n=1 Tax=Oceanotoga teriensis TaxID=515440 RepID=A0AA45C7E7_9BACT|nr:MULTISPECIES: PTS transporter subunit IIC [Oceanotoga]MDN5342685.1 galactitol system component [Oceanotoga sp.]PWJ95275.1 PTS system galactitol-specific IIC component [Oceanotoga teriensis]
MFADILNYILDLGAAIFLPIIMIILGLIMKMKPRKAIIAGLTLGVAFTGMNLVLGFMFDTISPVAQEFVKNTGIQFNTIDVGWSPMSAISWAWPYALLMFPVQIVLNIIILALNKTNVLNVDLWNVWGKIFTATMVAAITNSVILGFAAAIVQIILELKIGELNQKQIYEVTKIPGVTCTHYMTLQCVIMNPVNKLLDFIPGLKDSKMNADKLKDKIGIFGENSVMGFIIGGIIALVAGYTVKDSLNIAIKVATALVLFPMVAKLFMQALAPIADAAGEYMKKKFKDREIFIGLDWPFMAGQSEIWVVAILLVPLELLFAILMSKMGLSNILPLAGIVNIIVVVPALIVTGGNLIRMLILSIIFTPFYLFVSSSFAPFVTDLARKVGTINIPDGQMISYFGVEAPFFRWIISNGLAGDILGIIGMIIFAVCYYFFVKEMKKRNANL